MATLDTSICNKALKILRQDAEISSATGSPVAVKCASLYDLAYDRVASAHEWSTPMTGATPTAAHLVAALVYALAAELSIPVTGRQQDWEMMNDLFQKKLEFAKVKDLEDAFAAETDTDFIEALALIRQYALPDGKLPWSLAAVKRNFNRVKDGARKYCLQFYGWSFSRRESIVQSTADGAWYRTAVPPDCDRVLTCKGREGVIPVTQRENGAIFSERPVFRVEYTVDDGTFNNWPVQLKEAYIHRAAALMAFGMPNNDANKAQSLAASCDKLLTEERMRDARQNRVTYADAVTRNRYSRAFVGEIHERRDRRW